RYYWILLLATRLFRKLLVAAESEALIDLLFKTLQVANLAINHSHVKIILDFSFRCENGDLDLPHIAKSGKVEGILQNRWEQQEKALPNC
ncbi:MAG: hypothetical protein JZU50_11470, partial [Desulfobulbaceae bacterium]|nr:hypothetical protein [Desulfobulbaceae bacterium]